MSYSNKMRFFFYALLSRFFNFGFRASIPRILCLTLLSLLILSLSSTHLITDLLFSLFLGSSLSLSIVRLSNNFIYTYTSKHASMIVYDLTPYRRLDYLNDNLQMRTLLQREFKEALIYASKLKFIKKVRFSTHQWFVNNVVFQPEIEELYDISIKEKGSTLIAMEILILIPFLKILEFDQNLIQQVLRKRKGYSVVLKKKRH